jgi:hypothetical protein
MLGAVARCKWEERQPTNVDALLIDHNDTTFKNHNDTTFENTNQVHMYCFHLSMLEELVPRPKHWPQKQYLEWCERQRWRSVGAATRFFRFG